jgi:hypothetical protein
MTTWTQLVDTYPTSPVVGAGWRVTTITQWDQGVPLATRELTATAEAYYKPILLEYYGLYATSVTGNNQSVAFATLPDDTFTFAYQAGGSGVLPNVTLVQDIPIPAALGLFVLALIAVQLIIRPLTKC